MREKIIRNSARCNKCGDEIVSKHVHDFVRCSCGNLFVDGGLDYLRRGFKSMENPDYFDTSITEKRPDIAAVTYRKGGVELQGPCPQCGNRGEGAACGFCDE